MTDKPPILNQPDRLEALKRYSAFDVTPDPALDQLTELARYVCQASVAIVNFVGSESQFFKSVQGFEPFDVPLDKSICAHLLNTEDLIVIPDLTQDERFVENPLVCAAPNMRFYAGVILRSQEGHALGTLCVLDQEPRNLTGDQCRALQIIASQVMTRLELTRTLQLERDAVRRLEKLQTQVESSVSRMVFDRASVGMAIVSPELRFKDINRAFRDLFGYAFEQLKDKTVLDVVAAEDRDKLRLRLTSLLAEETSSFIVTARFSRHDGSPVWVKSSVSLVPNETGTPGSIVFLLENITSEIKAQQALRESEERLQFALEGAGDGVWDWNVSTNEVVFSKRWKAMLGFEPHEIGDDYFTWRDLVHAEDLAEAQRALEACLEGKTATFVSEYRMWHKSGQWVWMLARASVVRRDGNGQPLRMVGTITDITDMKRLTEELHRSYDLLSKLADQVPGVLYQFKLHPHGTISLPYVSRAIEDLLEITNVEAMSDASRTFSLVHPDDADEFRASIARSAETMQPWSHTYRVVLPSGAIRLVQGNSKPTKHADGSVVWHGFLTESKLEEAEKAT